MPGYAYRALRIDLLIATAAIAVAEETDVKIRIGFKSRSDGLKSLRNIVKVIIGNKQHIG